MMNEEITMIREQGFVRGDRVRVKTGWPVMTVEEVESPFFFYRYKCQWADRKGRVYSELFRADQLERLPDGDDRGKVTRPAAALTARAAWE